MAEQKAVKIALVSLEGVILNTRKHIKEYIDRNSMIFPAQVNETFDILELLHKFDNKFEIINNFSISNEWEKIEILDGAKEGLARFKERGFKVLLISQVDKAYQDIIEEKLRKDSLEFDAFIATGWATENQNLINFYHDILKPHITVISSLHVMSGFKQRHGKISYISSLEKEENPNHNFKQGKTLLDIA